MIPKKIHYCWYGNGIQNDTIKKCISSWKEKMPEYEIKRWDESNTPFEKLPFLQKLYDQKKWSFITDYIRLYSIYTEGGIYLDTDIEMVKTFDSFLNEKAFIGFQGKFENEKFPINSAVLGAQAKNEFILDCIKETERKQRTQFNAMGGPPIASYILKNYGLETYKNQHIKDVLVVTSEYFYPFSWQEKFYPECVTNNTICIHWWEDSWKNKKKGLSYILDSGYRKLKKLPIMLLDSIKYTFFKKNFFYIDKL
ncbi:mannosyltransferase OCH1-like enzyme [Galbibacter orientalis DSM 19592]|uniref:Mannosyltransferase OCH1-like enzyme n=1 Tax=Galbibacter orientalis DSM 19592 TaxID=926559 RepID=I3C980_9FLAO|nr:glycosyltransferase [Galbibacter orientalis]EIJ40173.1 mannosyltransferase OCH1-like enzyme [Galbibacter orientalis DSM 19592]